MPNPDLDILSDTNNANNTNQEIFELNPLNASLVLNVPVITVAARLKIASAPKGNGAAIILIIVDINITNKCQPSLDKPIG